MAASFSCAFLFTYLFSCTVLSIEWYRRSKRERVTRVQTTGRGTVVLAADSRATPNTSSTQQQLTSSTTSPTQSRDQTDETTFTDAQFSSGVAPPSYNTASDYKTVEV